MIFTVQVVDNDNQQSEESLAFVRYYAVKPSGKENKNATMRHLVWETVPVSGKQRGRQPSYGVVTVDSITQRACVCPHFASWKQGPQQDFLLNDILNLWPDLCRIPQGCCSAAAAAAGAATAAAAAATTAIEEAMQTPLDIAVCCMFLCFRHGRPSVQDPASSGLQPVTRVKGASVVHY